MEFSAIARRKILLQIKTLK